MLYGISGNTQKEAFWPTVAELCSWMLGQGLSFCLKDEIARGLAERDLLDAEICTRHRTAEFAGEVDVLLSFGGDGTLLRTAHQFGAEGLPILGINIGRLGFLADIEVNGMQDALRDLEAGRFRTEKRLLLEAELPEGPELDVTWALNEFVVDRSGPAGLISIDVRVDGKELNTFWADGLICATPTGSTAYALAAGSPIITPGSEVIVLAPVASHSLTVRPIILPASAEIEMTVETSGKPYLLAADGTSTMLEREKIPIRIRRADHSVQLIKLERQHYFDTLRSKLMWGLHNRT